VADGTVKVPVSDVWAVSDFPLGLVYLAELSNVSVRVTFLPPAVQLVVIVFTVPPVSVADPVTIPAEDDPIENTFVVLLYDMAPFSMLAPSSRVVPAGLEIVTPRSTPT